MAVGHKRGRQSLCLPRTSKSGSVRRETRTPLRSRPPLGRQSEHSPSAPTIKLWDSPLSVPLGLPRPSESSGPSTSVAGWRYTFLRRLTRPRPECPRGETSTPKGRVQARDLHYPGRAGPSRPSPRVPPAPLLCSLCARVVEVFLPLLTSSLGPSCALPALPFSSVRPGPRLLASGDHAHRCVPATSRGRTPTRPPFGLSRAAHLGTAGGSESRPCHSASETFSTPVGLSARRRTQVLLLLPQCQCRPERRPASRALPADPETRRRRRGAGKDGRRPLSASLPRQSLPRPDTSLPPEEWSQQAGGAREDHREGAG